MNLEAGYYYAVGIRGSSSTEGEYEASPETEIVETPNGLLDYLDESREGADEKLYLLGEDDLPEEPGGENLDIRGLIHDEPDIVFVAISRFPGEDDYRVSYFGFTEAPVPDEDDE